MSLVSSPFLSLEDLEERIMTTGQQRQHENPITRVTRLECYLGHSLEIADPTHDPNQLAQLIGSNARPFIRYIGNGDDLVRDPHDAWDTPGSVIH